MWIVLFDAPRRHTALAVAAPSHARARVCRTTPDGTLRLVFPPRVTRTAYWHLLRARNTVYAGRLLALPVPFPHFRYLRGTAPCRLPRTLDALTHFFCAGSGRVAGHIGRRYLGSSRIALLDALQLARPVDGRVYRFWTRAAPLLHARCSCIPLPAAHSRAAPTTHARLPPFAYLRPLIP